MNLIDFAERFPKEGSCRDDLRMRREKKRKGRGDMQEMFWDKSLVVKGERYVAV